MKTLTAIILSLANAVVAAPVMIDDGRQPQVAMTRDRVYVAYAKDRNLYCAESSDSGKTFRESVSVAEVNKMPVGMRRGPRIVASKNVVVMTAISNGDLLGWRSDDAGEHWSTIAKSINTVANAAREGLHGMAVGPRGEMTCVWLDLRNAGGMEIWGASSTDGGVTWSNDFRIYRSPEKSVCQCCHPSVVYSADGTIAVMFRNDLSGDRNMYLVESHDGGKTFGAAEKLGVGTWKLNACPMDGGMIAYSRNLITTWRRENKVFVASPGRPERELGDGRQPWIASTRDETFIAWIAGRPGDLMLARGYAKPTKLATDAADPSIAACGRDVFIAWESAGKVFGQKLAESSKRGNQE